MQRPLLLTGATLIDGVNPHPIHNASILIRNGRITAVGQGAEVGAPDGAAVIDMSGRWVIPGLIEMHTHIKDYWAPVVVAAGVTTVRNTASWLRELDDLRKAPPDAPTPRVIAAGRIIDGAPGLWGATSTGSFTTDSADAVREEVRREAAYGADLIKIYGMVTREMMLAAVEEASAHGLPVSCDFVHQTKLNVRDAAHAGVRWNEHASGFVQALYPQWTWSNLESWDQVPWDADHLPQLDALCEEVVAHGLMLCPTLTLWEQGGLAPDYWWPEHPAVAVFARSEGIQSYWGHFPDALALKWGKMFQFARLVARTFRKAGGLVVAGTDAPAGRHNPYGLALHREMQLLVKNGWSNLEALHAATSLAARTLNRDDIGRVRPGAWADMLVLTADPLADISNTLKTDAVIKGGRMYTSAELLACMPTEAQAGAKYERLMAEYQAGQHPEAPEGATAAGAERKRG